MPGNWTVQGVDDLPHYTNVQMPFPGPPPRLPDRNPTGVYRRDVPGARGVARPAGRAARRRRRERARGVRQRRVRRATAPTAGCPASTTSPPVSRPGDNELAIVVVQWSRPELRRGPGPVVDGRPAPRGACDREPRAPGRHPRRRRVVEPTPTGRRHRYAAVSHHGRVQRAGRREAGLDRRATLDDDSRPHASAARSCAAVPRRPPPVRLRRLRRRRELQGARRRSRGRPRRRPLPRDRRRCSIPTAAVVEVGDVSASASAGSRCAADELLVNGQPVMVRGVNRHDHHPERGKAVTVADMRADLVAMKRAQHQRGAHLALPERPARSSTCATSSGCTWSTRPNIESHAVNTSPVPRPRATRAALVERGRADGRSATSNHPASSSGRSATRAATAPNHDAAAGWIRALRPDATAALRGRRDATTGLRRGRPPSTDIVCPMYPPIDDDPRVRPDGARRAGR